MLDSVLRAWDVQKGGTDHLSFLAFGATDLGAIDAIIVHHHCVYLAKSWKSPTLPCPALHKGGR